MAERRKSTSPGSKKTTQEDREEALDRTEGNATLREVWDEPGGEAYAYRQAVQGGGNKDEDHSALTAAETPETTRHLSDARLTPTEKQALIDAATHPKGARKPKE